MAVDIDFPLSGSTVGRSFVANGTATTAPTVTLESGTLGVITGATVFPAGANNGWTSTFTLTEDYPDATLTATRGTEEAIESNINASDPPVKVRTIMSAPGVVAGANASITVSGVVGTGVGNAAVATVIVTVLGLKAGVATFLGSSGVTIAAGTTGWTAALLVPTLPAAGDKIVARVHALNPKGKVIGTAVRRIKL